MTPREAEERGGGFTPGPWQLYAGPQGGYQIEAQPAFDGPCVVCSRNPWPHRQAESEANARLIAAAPDLLAALQECLREHGGFTIKGECERQARAAISRALG
jgi:hypothetical protein